MVGAGVILAAMLNTLNGPEIIVGEPDIVPVATRLVVHKRAHTMDVYDGEKLLRKLRVSLGRGGLGRKEQQGDRRVPEGNYIIDGSNASSAFHLSLHISYPSPEQAKAAAARGAKPGGDIMIHGLPNDIALSGRRSSLGDWTDGCIAVTNPEIEWLWQSVPDGTPILIVP